MEEFRVIKDFENYEVSNFGRVRNVKTGKILKPYCIRGYCYVDFHNKKTRAVHRLVSFAFISNPNDKPIIDHIDNNPSNNNVCNLR